MLLTHEKGTVVEREVELVTEKKEKIIFQGLVYNVPTDKSKGEFMKELRAA